jgi:predicted esterase
MKITESTIKLASGLILGYILASPVKAKSNCLVFFHGQGEFPKGVDYNFSALKKWGPLKFANDLDWLPYHVIHLQGAKNKSHYNAAQCHEAIQLIYQKHGLKTLETQLSGLSQGGQACGDLIKNYNQTYSIYSSFSGVCQFTWSGHYSLVQGIYIFGDPKDSVMGDTKKMADDLKLNGTPVFENWKPGLGHTGWNNSDAYGATNENDLNSVYNWHKRMFAVQEDVIPVPDPVEETPPVEEDPVIIEPEKPVGNLTPQFLDIKTEMFSSVKDIKDVVKAILEEREPPVKWNEPEPYSMKIDLGKVFDVTKILVKDGQGTCAKPNHSIFKNDKGEVIGEFTGDKYNTWYQLSGPTRTRYIHIENVISPKKNLPIGLKISVLK